MPTKRYARLTPKMHKLLASWPAGERRRYLTAWYDSDEDVDDAILQKYKIQRPPVCYNHGAIERLVKLGYLTTVRQVYTGSQGHPWPYSQGFEWKRTSKPVEAHRPKEATAHGMFPWNVDDHWEHIERSPARAPRSIATQLLSSADYRERAAAHYDLQLQFPQVLRTKSELNRARTFLKQFFGGEDLTDDKQQYYLGKHPAGYMLATGESMHYLLMEMLIEPVFDDDGKFVRFRAVEPSRAAAEIERLTGGTLNIAERYRRYRLGAIDQVAPLHARIA